MTELSRRGALLGMGVSALANAQPLSGAAARAPVFDVIVVGFGIGGACAAVEAVRAGRSVLVVDKFGAAANASCGQYFYFGGGTSLQKRCGVVDTEEQMLRYLLSSTGPQPNDARIRFYVEHAVESFEWLLSLGMPFSADPRNDCLSYSGSERTEPWRSIAAPAKRGHKAFIAEDQTLSPGGRWLQRRLLAEVREKGATIITDSMAQRLLLDRNGRVTGVVVTRNGETKNFLARRGIVVATGGFALNNRRVAEEIPEWRRCTPIDVTGNDGWSLEAGRAAGAAFDNLDAGSATWIIAPPISRRQGVLISRAGLRFVAEDAYHGRIGDAVMREQGGSAYHVVDRRILADGPGRFVDTVIARDCSIPELSDRLRVPPETLAYTISRYNGFCDAGHDADFSKIQHIYGIFKRTACALYKSRQMLDSCLSSLWAECGLM